MFVSSSHQSSSFSLPRCSVPRYSCSRRLPSFHLISRIYLEGTRFTTVFPQLSLSIPRLSLWSEVLGPASLHCACLVLVELCLLGVSACLSSTSYLCLLYRSISLSIHIQRTRGRSTSPSTVHPHTHTHSHISLPTHLLQSTVQLFFTKRWYCCAVHPPPTTTTDCCCHHHHYYPVFRHLACRFLIWRPVLSTWLYFCTPVSTQQGSCRQWPAVSVVGSWSLTPPKPRL